jgi:hypothetical protein
MTPAPLMKTDVLVAVLWSLKLIMMSMGLSR